MRNGVKLAIGSAGLLAAGAAFLGTRRLADDRALARLERSLLDQPGAGRFTEERVSGLPGAARRYLLHAIAPGTPLAGAVRLDTDFAMRLTAHADKPVDLPGTEVLAPPRGLVWRARARIGPVPVRVGDHYAAGEGAVSVYALGLLPLVRATGPDVSRSARGRLAVEAIWLPSALLPGEDVEWEEVSEDQTRATLTIDGEPIPLTLTVGRDGSLREATMTRYGDVGVDSWCPIPYGVAAEAEATFNGYTIPTRLRGGWWYGTERYDPAKASVLAVVGATFRQLTAGADPPA